METKNVSQTAEALTDDLSALKQDITQITTDLREHAGAHADAVKSLVQEKIQAAREAATARPLAILGVGLLLGFLLGVRFRR